MRFLFVLCRLSKSEQVNTAYTAVYLLARYVLYDAIRPQRKQHHLCVLDCCDSQAHFSVQQSQITRRWYGVVLWCRPFTTCLRFRGLHARIRNPCDRTRADSPASATGLNPLGFRTRAHACARPFCGDADACQCPDDCGISFWMSHQNECALCYRCVAAPLSSLGSAVASAVKIPLVAMCTAVGDRHGFVVRVASLDCNTGGGPSVCPVSHNRFNRNEKVRTTKDRPTEIEREKVTGGL